MDNTSTIDKDLIIRQMSSDKTSLLIPAIVYIVILMVSGLLGNTAVCLYYATQSRQSTNSFFIVVLAIYDIISCCICMPGEIVDIANFYTFQNDIACKLLRYLNYVGSIGSVLTLMVIAVDRYRKIRTPTKRQMTTKHSKRISFVVLVVAVISSVPALIMQGAIKVNIPNELGIVLQGHDCTTTKEQSYKVYVLGYNLVLLLLFFAAFIVLLTLYGVIGTTVFRHRKTMSKYTRQRVAAKVTQRDLNIYTDQETSSNNSASTSSGISSPENAHSSIKSERSIDNESVRITLVMIIITLVFIFSFLPHLSLKIWRSLQGKHNVSFLSDPGLVGYTIGTRSYLLNSALNPWIYGIFNSCFRHYVYKKLCCK